MSLKKRVDEGTKLGRDVLNEMAPGIKSQIEECQAELRSPREDKKK